MILMEVEAAEEGPALQLSNITTLHAYDQESQHVGNPAADDIILEIPPDINAKEENDEDIAVPVVVAAMMMEMNSDSNIGNGLDRPPVPVVVDTVQNHNNSGSVDKSVLITIFTFLAAGTGSAIFSLPNNPRVQRTVLCFRDVLFHPSKLPNEFYSILFMTVAYTVSMIGVEVLLWSMIAGWPFWLRTFLLVGVGAFFFRYAFVMKKKVPQFSVVTSTHYLHSFRITSYWLVWVYGLSALIFILIMLWLLAKLISFAKQMLSSNGGRGGG